MNTHDKAPAAHPGGCASNLPASTKRAYQTPQVIELGDVRELTRSGGGSVADGRGGSRGKTT